jgi:hypothetical protein
LVEYTPFTTPNISVALTLSSHEMALETDCAPCERSEAAAEPSSPVAAAQQSEGDSSQGAIGELAGLIKGLQVHLDSRLDKVEGSLAAHEGRLRAIEKQFGDSGSGGRQL